MRGKRPQGRSGTRREVGNGITRRDGSVWKKTQRTKNKGRNSISEYKKKTFLFFKFYTMNYNWCWECNDQKPYKLL